MKHLTNKITVLILFLFVSFAGARSAEDYKPPVAEKNKKVQQVHGDELVDDYYWLREKEDPKVIDYLKAENEYAGKLMAHTKGLQEKLYKEMLSRIKETDLSVPYLMDGYYYYSRTEQGKQYPFYFRKKGSLEAAEELLLDLNVMAEGKTFMSLGAYSFSDDGNLLAFSTDSTGFRVYNLQIKDLQTGKILPDQATDVESVFWADDNKTLFYTTKDSAKRSYRLHRHTLGSETNDVLYEEKDERFNIYGYRTRSRKYMFLMSSSLTTTEARVLPASEPMGEWKVIIERKQGREFDLDHQGDQFLIRVNDTGRNFRLVSAPASDPSDTNWKEIVPHSPEIMLAGIDCFKSHYVLYTRQDGLNQFRITNIRTNEAHHTSFPEPVYAAYSSFNPEWNTNLLRFSYTSMITPASIYDYDMETKERVLLKQYEVMGGYDPTQYVSERIHATAADGTQIPVSLVYKKGFEKNGKAPLLLEGYGSYGSSYPVYFSSNRLSLTDRGFASAIAHIRGGAEMGKTWHDQGRMMNKMNTFTDFVAAAEHLIKNQYTSKDGLIVEGGSAGGLLMGAVTNLRPDLFKAVVSHVPFVDVINTMLDPSLPLTVTEFEEWGNPKNKEEYLYLKKYCPYTNLAAKDYPSLLVKTSLNDSQVMYWEPAKYVAKMRSLKTDKNPLIFVINMGAGHGGSSGRYDHLRETALDYAFMLDQAGIKE